MSKKSNTPQKSKKSKKAPSTNIDQGAVFFTDVNFEGLPYIYMESPDVIELHDHNDEFLSVDVGTSSKVYAWQHWDSPGQYGEWETDQPDLNYMGGISRIKVTPNNNDGIYVKLTNNTGDGKVYEMTIHVSEDIGDQVVLSNEGVFRLVGIIEDDATHIAQIAVRPVGEAYVANGSCFFNNLNHNVSIDEGENFPPNMSVTEESEGHFNFSLNSV